MGRWLNTSFGKLVIGGCGFQIGSLLACLVILALGLVVLACTLAGLLAPVLTPELAGLPGATPAPAGTPAPGVIDSLISQVRLLQNEVEYLRANPAPVVLAPTPSPTPTPRPFLMANEKGVNLRSGPGTNYAKIGVLPVGEGFEIVGRNADSTWWLIVTRDRLFAWVSAGLVTATSLHEAIPVITIPSLLAYTPGGINGATILPETGVPAAVPVEPAGTPIPEAAAQRVYVEDMPAYGRLRGHLLVPPVSASVSPDGSQIAITERIKIYTVTTEGALTKVWLEDDDKQGPLGQIVWSPDGQRLAFVVGFKERYCTHCRAVVIMRLDDGSMLTLKAPDNKDTDMPRWTTDGRLLVNVHPGEPAQGVAYVYDVNGLGQPAAGTYSLSASHEGQKWYPWRPGRLWQVGRTERADSYNSDE